jgi:5-oxoprolinase (ATP-hydrolysing)
VLRTAHLKYAGTDTALAVDYRGSGGLRAAFEAAHERRYGFTSPEKGVVVAALCVEAVGAAGTAAETQTRGAEAGAVAGREGAAEPAARVAVFSGGTTHEAPVFMRASLGPGDRVLGPAVIVEANATTVVEPGWRAEMLDSDRLVLTRVMSVAEQMGVTLANTAQSVNIKERLDFSCAVFDQAGQLIANAPHVPVHLGSMGESVQTVLASHRETMRRGDVYVLNAPYNGGTHLPDITVVTPVFDAGDDVLFFIASRGHHADVGGVTPGSMPPESLSVEEEGVLIDDVQLVAAGRFREAEIMALLTSGAHPARNPGQNVADLKAQVAANETGVRELEKVIDHFGLDVVHAYMSHVQDNAEESVRRVLDVLHDGDFVTAMDDGAEIRVQIRIDKRAREAVIDFTGTSPQRPNNFNAPFAVTRAAVLYVFRTLVDDDIPLNSGCLKPLRLVIPERSMLNPRFPAAVVAGNVETSQCVADALYGALGALAAAQGTMNNFTFGNARHQYYETLCGGSGAGPDFDGTDAVHTHMTNSRLTDPEVLEWRYPVLVEGFSIRSP